VRLQSLLLKTEALDLVKILAELVRGDVVYRVPRHWLVTVCVCVCVCVHRRVGEACTKKERSLHKESLRLRLTQTFGTEHPSSAGQAYTVISTCNT